MFQLAIAIFSKINIKTSNSIRLLRMNDTSSLEFFSYLLRFYHEFHTVSDVGMSECDTLCLRTLADQTNGTVKKSA